MNKQLLEFIELCLVDGVISDKEREIIFRKSKELGIPKDECEIILKGLIYKHSHPKYKNEGRDDLSDIEISDNYFDLNEVNGWIKNVKHSNELLNDFFEKRITKYFNSGGFRKYFSSLGCVLDRSVLEYMMNQSKLYTTGSFFNRVSITTYEYEKQELINRIFNTEEFLGYIYYNPGLGYSVNKTELEEIIESPNPEETFPKGYEFVIWTNSGFHFFRKSKYPRSEKDYHDFVDNKSFTNLNVNILDDEVRLDGFLLNENLGRPKEYLRRFLYSCYLDFDIKDYTSKLYLSFENDLFLSKVNTFKFKEHDFTRLMRVNRFITKSITEYNLSIENFSNSNFLLIRETEIKTVDRRFKSSDLKTERLEEFMTYCNEFILFFTHLLFLRDSFLNSLIKSKNFESNDLFLQLEDIGVFNTQFERESLEGVGRVITKLTELNKRLIEVNENLKIMSSQLNRIGGTLSRQNEKLDNQNLKLSEIDEKLSYNNLITTINTYQTWKMNKNTKQLN
tara:strand:- start:753 stop:2273 length:1521 start_codon:yes stop_codon:yes gene_type:complete